MKLIVTHEGKEVKVFEKQTSDFEAFRYLLDHQPQSVDWAVKYGKYDVIFVNEETGEVVKKYSDQITHKG